MPFQLPHQVLLQWYEIKGRHDLPWRQTKNLYHIYVSEIMLQQTQVQRVKEYFYPNFLEKYPSLQALADAKIDDVLIQWSGLGYYSRARNLHKTSQILAPKNLPNSLSELEKLPGIGKYTASAICSFGLHQSIPVVDTNISRVIKRYFALLELKESVVWKQAEQFLNHNNPTSHNLALMDLGSMVCTPKDPCCDQCPLEKTCQGKDEPHLYTLKKKLQYENLELFFGVLIENNKIALTKSVTKLYHGMYQLPNIDPIDENKIGTFKHSYTKYKITVNLYKVQDTIEDIQWINLTKLDTVPFSSMMTKAFKILQEEQLLQ